MQRFCKALELAPSLLYVGDSAMYANCVKHGNDLLWLSRVPESMNLSKELLLRTDITWIDLSDGYKMYPIEKEYAKVKQRWILIYSAHKLQNMQLKVAQKKVKPLEKLSIN